MTDWRLAYSRRSRGQAAAVDASALRCDGVWVRYGRAARPALREINLIIPTGARVALVGANGAGKSTLLKAAAGLLPVSSGAMRIHGLPVGGCRDRVAYLSQRGDLDWRFPITVHRLVLSGRYVHLGWFKRPGRVDVRRVESALELLHIGDLADRRIGELSGGQQQRVLLARALTQDADLLLLDEPLNAVDVSTRELLREVLRSLAASGKTIITATHDPHDVGSDYDTVLRLSDGRQLAAEEEVVHGGHG